MKKVIVCLYRGMLGVIGFIESPILRKPFGNFIDLKEVEFTPEAVEFLKTAPKKNTKGPLAPIMLSPGDEKDPLSLFGWLGNPRTVFDTRDERFSVNESFDGNLLVATEGIEVPEEFKTFVDNSLNEDGTVKEEAIKASREASISKLKQNPIIEAMVAAGVLDPNIFNTAPAAEAKEPEAQVAADGYATSETETVPEKDEPVNLDNSSQELVDSVSNSYDPGGEQTAVD